jgi:hypothetical protein
MTDVPSPELIALARRLAEAGKLPRLPRSSSERRYSDEELARILEEATHSEVHGEGSGEESGGYSLAEIHEIAREAGIDLEQVDRAAARLGSHVESPHLPPAGSKRRGISRVVHEERVIGRALSDGEMKALAEQVQLAVNQPGHSRAWGDWVEWRDEKDRLYVGVVRAGGRTRIRVIAEVFHKALSVVVAAMVSILLVSGLTELSSPLMLIPLLIIIAGVLWKFWGWQASRTRRELNELLDVLEDSVRDG